jgi:disulfide bond formation protein DsbB
MDAPFFNLINTTIMVGSVVLQVLSVALFLGLCGVPGLKKLVPVSATYGMKVSLVVLLASLFGSLYYSEIAGFPACVLCWYQRTMIYPQVILFAVAIAKQKRDVFLYTNTLSIIGLVIALYNILIQTFQNIPTFCDPFGNSVSCLTKYIEGFGYITIPVMSATLFVFLLLIGWAAARQKKLQLVVPLA